ncbi:tRNA (adenosine(37)-N6)-threonylcarbamoyltransferase complex transferase subunit TsaD [Patescibacteria group bacterium]|nr:tRNA (adenosine(37)-N6)-threonylcarbamoyltransferase complex transferase subunit TsaD [Patescibacteria group bacterium]MBU1034226.1 tRNA (adenosine(37)-N6)-threonylcarbamoyltransferase complex transferase subunit TsaD [Patescibacteria group bacterium]MBU1629530.1 tRNA (adenosine(37)-N6)-threonylcarbamoyltransferase complex transferase subunit TsaD [Patescibacteria group bacterium]MBU1907546.1 tRNA (adenosine(37)-N6)-threonylcarbamoyltransferase complex transferase subunit TsaD [Patescibacteri
MTVARKRKSIVNRGSFRVLGIETSCDETSVAILKISKNSVEILHHEIASQIPVHEIYGGVVPEVAARLHVKETVELLDRAMATHYSLLTTHLPFDVIAVAQGPGLATALRVGIDAARTLAFALEKPIVGVNHLEGHLASAWLVSENRKHWKFPILFLLVSGGHTELVLMKDFCSYRVIGRTRDDAAGEAFDKTGKLIGLSYPAGPQIAKLAENGNPRAFDIPRPMINDPSFDFSFSGLKSAVRRLWEKMPQVVRAKKKTRVDLCASIQEAIVDVLVAKTIAAARKHRPQQLAIVGGVSANHHLQERLRQAVKKELRGVSLLKAARGLHTDNAAMIAAAGAWHFRRGERHDWRKIDAQPEWDL